MALVYARLQTRDPLGIALGVRDALTIKTGVQDWMGISTGVVQRARVDVEADTVALIEPNYALSFDGVDDQVSKSNPVGLPTSGPWTLEAFVKPLSVSGDQAIVVSGNTAETNSIDLRFLGSQWRADVWNVVASDGGTVQLGVWKRISGTYDGSNLRLYENGVLVAGPTPLAWAGVALDIMRIGRRPNGGSGFDLNAVVDDVRIWNVARTQTQIQENMSKRLVGNESGLVGYWPMQEGAGLIVADATANGNNGTITGATWTAPGAPVG